MGLFANNSVTSARNRDVMLTEEDFICLVRGGVLTVNSCLRIALQDIGFDRMYKAIKSAELGIDIQKPRDREND